MKEWPTSPEKLPAIKWRKPTLEDLRYEGGEAERVLGEVFGVTKNDEDFEQKMHAFALAALNGEYIQLTEEMWSKLENTDSYMVKKGDLKQAKEFAQMNGRTFDNLIDAIKKGIDLPAPTILDYGKGLHKIAGNTRLMIAHAKGEHPMVLVVKFDGTV